MVSLYSICLLLVGGAWAAIVQPGLAIESSALSKRDVSISGLLGIKGAVLIINGNQTSCEAALIDSGSAFVAASCLQYKNGNLDTTANYQLSVYMGSNGAGTQIYGISQITVHPQYSSSLYINNLAVVQFNPGASIAWSYLIGINPSEWSHEYFARRSLAANSAGNTQWNNILALDSMDSPSDCATYSSVFVSNSKDFICNPGSIQSIYNQACSMPYGTVYGVVQPSNINIVALHSFSVVVGGNMCSSNEKLHYYTVLRNYAAWAAQVIGRPIGGFVKAPGFTMKPNYNFSMKSNATVVGGAQVFAGDRFVQDPVDPALVNNPQNPNSTPTTTSSTSTKSTNTSTTKSTTSSKTNISSNTTGTSTTPTLVDNNSDGNSSDDGGNSSDTSSD
ncbi:hypothetical protein GGI21_005531, partial [Coemansia aciculifera]